MEYRSEEVGNRHRLVRHDGSRVSHGIGYPEAIELRDEMNAMQERIGELSERIRNMRGVVDEMNSLQERTGELSERIRNDKLSGRAQDKETK